MICGFPFIEGGVKSRIKKGKAEGLEGQRGKKLFGICFVFSLGEWCVYEYPSWLPAAGWW